MTNLPTGLISHTRRVQSLYKRVLRNLDSIYDRKHIFRYHATLMRARFESNRNITDMRIARDLVDQGNEELFQNFYPQQKIFADSYGGVAFERNPTSPDWVLDFWHPLEKAQYPEYFARREQRKVEFVKLWLEKYGEPEGGTTASRH